MTSPLRFALKTRIAKIWEKHKIYQVLQDDKAKAEDCLRIIDESGKDYLYPESYFVAVELPVKAQTAFCLERDTE